MNDATVPISGPTDQMSWLFPTARLSVDPRVVYRCLPPTAILSARILNQAFARVLGVRILYFSFREAEGTLLPFGCELP